MRLTRRFLRLPEIAKKKTQQINECWKARIKFGLSLLVAESYEAHGKRNARNVIPFSHRIKSESADILCAMERKPVIVCIGTKKVSGDSLGPRVGDLLRDVIGVDAYVYGVSAKQVTAVNFDEYRAFIERQHKNDLIIAVDACVGESNDVGKIKVTMTGVTAGGALKRNFEKFGDIGILGVVAESGSDNFGALKNVKEQLVNRLALLTAHKVSALLDSLVV